jgi:hypothetical protein
MTVLISPLVITGKLGIVHEDLGRQDVLVCEFFLNGILVLDHCKDVLLGAHLLLCQ